MVAVVVEMENQLAETVVEANLFLMLAIVQLANLALSSGKIGIMEMISTKTPGSKSCREFLCAFVWVIESIF